MPVRFQIHQTTFVIFSPQPIEASVLRIFGTKYSFDAFILQSINAIKVKIWVLISLQEL